MSLECAKAACSENHLNLLYKWIAEERFDLIGKGEFLFDEELFVD